MPTPTDAATSYQHGVAAIQRGDLLEAMGHLKAAVAASPSNHAYWVALIVPDRR